MIITIIVIIIAGLYCRRRSQKTHELGTNQQENNKTGDNSGQANSLPTGQGSGFLLILSIKIN